MLRCLQILITPACWCLPVVFCWNLLILLNCEAKLLSAPHPTHPAIVSRGSSRLWVDLVHMFEEAIHERWRYYQACGGFAANHQLCTGGPGVEVEKMTRRSPITSVS